MKTSTDARIVVLGASDKPERYSYKAVKLLKEKGFHDIVPVSPRKPVVEGIASVGTLGEVPQPIDTLTLYVGEAGTTAMQEEILNAKPRRIVMNPGAENPSLAAAARENGIEVVEHCTLVMLTLGEF